MEKRINILIKLAEEREKSKQHFEKHQQIVKSWFDQASVSNTYLQVGDLVLKWDKSHEDKGEHAKFQRLRLGPFIIVEKWVQVLFDFKLWKVSPKPFQLMG